MSRSLDRIITNALAGRKLETLVENRTSFTLDNAQLNVYETHRRSESVSLTFDVPVLASMIKGKKVMHLRDRPAFEFLPGESLVVPSGHEMIIDFPIACEQEPTQCLALAFAPSTILKAVEIYNDHTVLSADHTEWTMGADSAHLIHDPGVNDTLHRLVKVFTEDIKAKEAIAELTIRELLLRLLQTNARDLLLNFKQIDPRLTPVIRYIRSHIQENINIETLAQQAFMSQGHFFRYFKNVMGITPVDFINQEKINKAKVILSDKQSISLNEVACAVGYSNTSYFIKLFKKYTGCTPSQFRSETIGHLPIK